MDQSNEALERRNQIKRIANMVKQFPKWLPANVRDKEVDAICDEIEKLAELLKPEEKNDD